MALIVKIRKKLDNFELNADIQTGDDILALSGASGAGKTMILKCIAGIETPDSGFISLNGRVLFDSEKNINLKAALRKTGYLFQDYALFPTMTARENISIVMKKKDTKFIDKWLKSYGLEEVADNYPKRLSGGQKQRVAMLRMLASKPECILLDEPFSALDEHIKRKMESELMEMLEDFHKPIIFVSHNREEIYRFADKVCSVEDGAVSRIHDKNDFFYKPETRAQAKLAGCLNFSDIRWVDESHIYALDWDITLEVGKTEKSRWKEYHSIGIFQSDIKLSDRHFSDIDRDEDKMSNIIKIKSVSVTEELYNISYMCGLKNGSFITVITSKQNRAFCENEMFAYKYLDVKYLVISKQNIHLLR